MLKEIDVAEIEILGAFAFLNSLIEDINCSAVIIALECQISRILNHYIRNCLDLILVERSGVCFKVEFLNFLRVVLPLLEVDESH